ncbi:hypothetical protein HYR99_00075 [Candidatus Poribacteria bacterium]|nr:hypothetical protein [Candidatus Poribacteria bacterium]
MKPKILTATLLFLTALFCPLALAGVGEWTPIGPEGGWVEALAVTPNGSLLYAGTGSGGGVFRSTDGGNSWTAVNSGLTDVDVRALAICPDTPTTMYAGTNAGGVFRSTDGGDHWTAVNTGLTNFSVWALAIRPDTPILYAGTFGNSVFSFTETVNSNKQTPR